MKSKTMDDVSLRLEELRKEAYEQGYEDGYDAGCMDLIDEEEDTW